MLLVQGECTASTLIKRELKLFSSRSVLHPLVNNGPHWPLGHKRYVFPFVVNVTCSPTDIKLQGFNCALLAIMSAIGSTSYALTLRTYVKWAVTTSWVVLRTIDGKNGHFHKASDKANLAASIYYLLHRG